MFKVRLVITAKMAPDRWLEDAWRDVEIPMMPFVGMELNLKDDFLDLVTVQSIQWVERVNRIHVRVGYSLHGSVDMSHDGGYDDELFLDQDWNRDGLWRIES